MIVKDYINVILNDVSVVGAGWSHIKRRRDFILQLTDWTQSADSPLSEELKEKYRIYRKELRELPQKYPNPDDVIWPVSPTDKYI